jgi:hypothetical protein
MPNWLIPWVIPGPLVVVAVLSGVVGSLHGGRRLLRPSAGRGGDLPMGAPAAA